MGFITRKPNPGKVDSLIGIKTVFEGKLNVYGGIRIDGTVNGNIECQGVVVVGTQGKVKGDVAAESAIIGGEIIGNINARESLEIVSQGKVIGDIATSRLIIAEGVTFEGFCHMLGSGPAVPSPEDEEERLLPRLPHKI
jgi:cytoskeletal protein CcmA (bactofilin family)